MNTSRKQRFMARLKSLQDRQGMRIAEYADFLGLPETRVRDFLDGKRLPMASELWRIAAKEHVSSDWLIGLSASIQPASTPAQSGLTDVQQEFLAQKLEKGSQLKKECEDIVGQCLAQGKRLSDDPHLLEKNMELDDIMLWCDIVNSLSASAACKQ